MASKHKEVSDFAMSLKCNRGDVGNRVAMFQQKSEGHHSSQKSNPFSQRYAGASRHKKTDETYGKPPEGSKTEMRGKQAGTHISGEIVQLCEIITDIGVVCDDGLVRVTFGELFEFYTKVSNKLVGMIMRARKQGLLHYNGEMLFQRRDDDVVITLLKHPKEIHEINLNYQKFN